MTAASKRLHPVDAVTIAMQDVEIGTTLPDHGPKLVTAVNRGHTFARDDFALGDTLPAPGLTLATRTEMHTRMAEDMDINCGDIIAAGVSIACKGREIFEALVAVASGKQTKSEELGFGGAEFVQWQVGTVM